MEPSTLDGTWNPMPTQFNAYQNSYRHFLHFVAKFLRHTYKGQSQEARRVLKAHTEQRTLPSLFVQSLAFVPHSKKPRGEKGPDTVVRNPLSVGNFWPGLSLRSGTYHNFHWCMWTRRGQTVNREARKCEAVDEVFGHSDTHFKHN